MDQSFFNNTDGQNELSVNDIEDLLNLEKKEDLDLLYKRACRVKNDNLGEKVFFRGLIELSNICQKNCYYCGIRKDNSKIRRYMMKESEIIAAAVKTWKSGYGSLVLQGGEQQSEPYTLFIEKIIKKIKELTEYELGITLSLGEQSLETYRRWRDAGAHRYLLRIETSDRKMYKKLHPDSHKFSERIESLENLKKSDYQVGTGVMSGLPFQSAGDLARDILFFKDMDVDMVGMGPYIVQDDTPFAVHMPGFDKLKKRQLLIGLKMIAVTRIILPEINIAATTALQTLSPKGRELGLLAGANIIMPNLSDSRYRKDYSLYDGKPVSCKDQKSSQEELIKSIEGTGVKIAFNEWGDSKHYKRKKQSSITPPAFIPEADY